jgi:hypothetical protein
MLANTIKKVTWMARATTTIVGLAIMLALVMGVATTALAGTGVGATFNLGKVNTVNALSKLAGSVAGPSLAIDNDSTDAAATALDLQVEPGKPPMKVNSSTEVQGLNADQLNGKSANEFLGRFEAASNSNLLDGKDSTAFAPGANGKAFDADKLDGKDSTELQGFSKVSARSVTVSTAAGANGSGVARCLAGELATGGGVDLVSGNAAKIHYFEPGGKPAGSPLNSWEAGWFAEAASQVRVIVVCAS